MSEDPKVLAMVEALQAELLQIEASKADPESRLDKRALSIAATHLETAMLWIANARPDE